MTGTGRHVVAVSRTAGDERADAADPATAATLLERYRPKELVLVAGATPPMKPVQDLTWAEFSTSWSVDVRIAFEWIRGCLTLPLPVGSRVVVLSSGAAVFGSPLSGGYAGAKATTRFLARYAHEEAERAELGISFVALLPRLTPLTDLGRTAVEAYATRGGAGADAWPAPLTPAEAGAAVQDLLDAPDPALAYLLAPDGPRPL